MTLVDDLLRDWRDAAHEWEALRGPIERDTGLRTWNPQLYGLDWYARFAAHYAPRKKGALLLLGLNPGKYGMSQTGLPFTSVTAAREQLPKLGWTLDAPGLAPPDLRPFLKAYRVERSSQSVYAFLDLAYGDVERGWRDAYAVSPVGLLFLERDGANVTPADARLKRDDVRALRLRVVERALATLRPRGVVVLGQDVARAVGALVPDAVIVDHPVARGPGRRGPQWWARTVRDRLVDEGLLPAPRS